MLNVCDMNEPLSMRNIGETQVNPAANIPTPGPPNLLPRR